MKVTFDLQAERTTDATQLGNTDRSKLGISHAKVAQAERMVRLIRIDLREQPSRATPWGEKLDDR